MIEATTIVYGCVRATLVPDGLDHAMHEAVASHGELGRHTTVTTRCGLVLEDPDLRLPFVLDGGTARRGGIVVVYDPCPECRDLPPWWPL